MRRLSAIMFTDLVGYSALSQKNEALALELLEEHRKLLRPLFKKFDGREIGTAGDAFFVEFSSAVEATHCAIEIQTSLHERNKTEPEERHILLRIGLHIGDVVYADENLYGDGVNIAARMEPLARPGGICLSEDVARQIRNKVPYLIMKLGKGKLKNITLPVDIYSIVLPWLQPEQTEEKKVSRKTLMILSWTLLGIIVISGMLFFFRTNSNSDAGYSRFRLAVLPLANISNNPDDEYFADGMTEELISNLSKISGLNVIARTSIMKYKQTNKDITQIGDELMVGTILEGSVRKMEDKARITVQLIDVATQEHIWSSDYDRELKDIFMVQSEIAQNVAQELKVRLVSSEKDQLAKKHTENTAAFQAYLLGKQLLNQKTSESIQTSITHFEESANLDTAFALPYANLAYAYTLVGSAGYGNIPRAVAEAKAKDAVMHALRLDETLAEAHAALGYIKFRMDWDWKGAEQEFKRAIELKPGYATAHEWYALFLSIHTRLDEALREMQKAYQLDPLSPSVNNGLARVYHFRSEFDQALTQINKTIELDPNYAEAHFTKGLIYLKMKEYAKADTELQKAIELSGRRPVMIGVQGIVYARMGKTDTAKQLLAALQKPPMNKDKLYAASFIKFSLGQTTEALHDMERLLDEKYGLLIYIKVEKDMFKGHDHPGFQKMLERMGLL